MSLHYQHSQAGTLVRIAMVPVFLMVVVFGVLTFPAAWYWFLLLAGVLAFTTATFGTLKTEVDACQVTVSFGLGWIRRRIPLARITAVRAVRNPWYFGWGIRLIPKGWLWNVSGFDAVELTLDNGRRFRIGTDDPHGLERAVVEAIGAAR